MTIKLGNYAKYAQLDAVAVAVTSDRKEWPKEMPSALTEEIERLRRLGDLNGNRDEVHVLYPKSQGPKRLIVCGLGASGTLTLQDVRKAAGRLIRRAQSLKVKDLAVAVDTFGAENFGAAETAQALALAVTVAGYQYREFKREEAPAAMNMTLLVRQPAACARAAESGAITGEAANAARTLANRPGNKLYPQALAREARRLSRRHPGLTVNVLQKPQLEKAGFGALLAVGGGSAHSPVLIEIIYRGSRAGRPPIALVGKGITFDSGGISLKPGANMGDMKFDMSGAAAVLGTLLAAARLKLPVNLVGVIPAAENLPSATAYRPGDILTSLSGQTIEVLNTDAEGRLILADALTYALRHKPACLVDIATLTGAVSVALGPFAIGLMSNRDELAGQFIAAGENSGERVWRLPLWDEYRELIKSEIADMSNISPKPVAGTIVGSAFLEKFTGRTPWAHLDIAATAYGEGNALYAKGATGVGVRLLVEWLKSGK